MLVKLAASGMCHSDEHLRHRRPRRCHGADAACIGGHEGAGVVLEVGPGVFSRGARRPRRVRLRPGLRPLPELRDGHPQPVRPRRRHRHRHADLRRHRRHHARRPGPATWRSACSARSPTTPSSTRPAASRSTRSCPLDRACLLGCGVVTGWGSAVYAAEVEPGDTVAVVGVGGIGSNADPGRQARRRPRHRRHRSGRVQAREGDGVRRDAHVRVDRRGTAAIWPT